MIKVSIQHTRCVDKFGARLLLVGHASHWWLVWCCPLWRISINMLLGLLWLRLRLLLLLIQDWHIFLMLLFIGWATRPWIRISPHSTICITSSSSSMLDLLAVVYLSTIIIMTRVPVEISARNLLQTISLNIVIVLIRLAVSSVLCDMGCTFWLTHTHVRTCSISWQSYIRVVVLLVVALFEAYWVAVTATAICILFVLNDHVFRIGCRVFTGFFCVVTTRSLRVGGFFFYYKLLSWVS